MTISKQSGLAMVIVIWVLSLLTIMAGSFALTMRREVTVISAVKDNAVALAVAETGIAVAQKMLYLTDKNIRWRADGSVYPLKYQGTEIRVRVFSEDGKVDINKADEVLLTTMMASTDVDSGKQQELVSAILDWRDGDELVRINGAEKEQYQQAGLAYQPANREFQRIDELQMVLGISNDIYQQLKPLVTVYSKKAQVNLNVASKEVIKALGKLEIDVLEGYLQQRIENNLAQRPAPTFPLIENSRGKQSGKGNEVYTVISQAQLSEDGMAGLKVTLKKSTNSMSDSPVQILNWQKMDNKQSLFVDDMTQLLVIQDEPENRY